MEQIIIGLYFNGYISFLQIVKYIKHKRNMGLKDAKTFVEVLLARYGNTCKISWEDQQHKLDFPLAFIVTDEDRVNWLEETEQLILKFIETHAQSENNFSSN